MTMTTNLGLVLLETGQVDKEVVVNDALDILDSVLAGTITHNMSSDNDYTINTATDEQLNLCIKITDTGNLITANRNIILPDNQQLHIAWNNTGGGWSLVFKTLSGTGVTVADGEKKLIFSDGVNIQFAAGLQSLEYPVDIFHFNPGVTTNSQLVFLYPITRMTEFPVNLSGSQCLANTAATASTVFSLKKNGTEFATITFAIAGTVATFVAASATTLSPGDYISLVAPATADATLADIGFTFKVSNLAV